MNARSAKDNGCTNGAFKDSLRLWLMGLALKITMGGPIISVTLHAANKPSREEVQQMIKENPVVHENRIYIRQIQRDLEEIKGNVKRVLDVVSAERKSRR